jgi:hypothetical protein
MNENQDPEIVQIIDLISKVDFISGKRDSNQYIFPIMRVLSMHATLVLPMPGCPVMSMRRFKAFHPETFFRKSYARAS